VTRLTDESEPSGALTSPFSRLARLRRVLRRGEHALRKGDLDAAGRAGRRVLDRLGTDSDDLTNLRPGELGAMISGLELLACIRRELTDFVGCVELHQQALTALELGPGGADHDQLRLATLVRLGETLRLLGQFPGAENVLERAMQLADTLHPPDPINRAMALNDLGILYKDTQRFEQAEQHYRQALHLLEQTLGADHLELAPLYHNLAGLEHAQDRFTEGEPFARHAIEIRAKHEGLETTGASGDLAVLGALLLGQKRYAEAETVLERSLAIWQGKYGPQHYEAAVVKHNLAAIYQACGDQSRALRTYADVFHIKSHILGPTHPDVVSLHQHIARLSEQPNNAATD
jgi:tetratricopeptide (TPR) repeat protein